MNYKKTLKPYLINAFYTWAMDVGNTPLIEINNHKNNVIPDYLAELMPITLNIHPNATRNMIFSKDIMQFEAVFGGKEFQVSINYDSIAKIFSKEDGYGLEFAIHINQNDDDTNESNNNTSEFKPIKQKKHLTLIKND